MLPASEISFATLRGLNLIEDNVGDNGYSFSHIPMDEASIYSPAQVLEGAEATLAIEDIDANSKLATVAISWTTATGRERTITTGTVIGGYR